MAMPPDEDRVPVVVAAAQVVERDGPVRAIDLLERAASAALDRAPALRPAIDRLSVVGVLSRVGPAPAASLAHRLALEPAALETTTIGGNTPQWLVTRAASDVAAGRLGATLVVGGEAMRSAKLGPASSTSGDEPRFDPDPVVGDDRPGVGPAETAIGLVLPVHIYAVLESALAARAGRSLDEQRGVMAELLAPFSEVAAKHPYSWFQEPRSAAELAEPGPDNRIVAEPYTKRMAAYLNVDQAAALVVTSLGMARRAGLADQAVFLWAGADTTDVWFPSARPDLALSPGVGVAAGATFDAAGVGVDDVGAFDLYSCFPSAVEMACDALGLALDDERALTVTGGLPSFGGPGNNYTTHAIATMADRLREDGGLGLVSGLGWYVTKHSYGLYGADPPPGGFARGDSAEAQAAIDATALPVATSLDADSSSRATVEGSTVIYQDEGVSGAPVIARLDDGHRVVAAAAPEELDGLRGRSLVGACIMVAGRPPQYRVEGT